MTNAAPADTTNTVTQTKLDKIAILDCGAQYTKVIDRRVREMNVSTVILPLGTDPINLDPTELSGIIISGGPGSVYEAGSPQCDAKIFQLGLPILGICYGMQLMNHIHGGVIESTPIKEYGVTEIEIKTDSKLFLGLERKQSVLMSHGDSTVKLAEGFSATGSTTDGIVAAIENPTLNMYGVQFHPEVELSENGQAMLRNFLYNIAGCSGNFVIEDRLEGAISQIQQQVGSRNVFVLVSGGVDSSVTAALLLKALGPEKVFAVHIDSGFMRHNESDLVCDALKALGLKHLQHIKAQDDFLNTQIEIQGTAQPPLKEVTDPELKRRIIGDVFYQLTQKAISAQKLDLDNTLIAQGTLRPDLIESGNPDVSTSANTIKTHHNDVPVIQEQRKKGLIIEPNRDWHKDEVRQVGRLLGLPEALVIRQPFPGPGLAIRTLCADRPYVTDEFEQIQEHIRLHTKKVSTQNVKLDARLLPVKSVGVQGDARSYRYLAVLFGDYETLDWPTLQKLAQDIPNQVHAVNRVALVLNQKSLPELITDITPTHLTPETLTKLQKLDHAVAEAFQKAGYFSPISQLLSVLLPIDTQKISTQKNNTQNQGRHSLAIRGVVTSDYMTARPVRWGEEVPFKFLQELSKSLSAIEAIDLVMVDITGKPPATVEWE
ncbi:MAG: glutamine-hydrolyzing GMP synthase [Vampirovibrionales bacterium]|nr:glutamine-hydrolyzing GMP synthase [Vampirovibrionales bacterium]